MNIELVMVLLTLGLVVGCNSDKGSFDKRTINKYNIEINKGVENNECWATNPMSIALHLVGSNLNCEQSELSISKLNKGEVANKVKIILIEKGELDDDDPKDSKYIVFLIKESNTWQFFDY